jgi:hypothetical protein
MKASQYMLAAAAVNAMEGSGRGLRHDMMAETEQLPSERVINGWSSLAEKTVSAQYL